MNLERYYDTYWQVKDEGLDPERIQFVLDKVSSSDRVLDLGCGPGKMTAEIHQKCPDVIGLDFSEVVLAKARARGVQTVKADLDDGGLPFDSQSFDAVVFTQTIEHLFNFKRSLVESSRVLREGGKLILSVPNIAHWRFRLALLCGRFPYIEDTQTHSQHIRFFTVKDTKALCRDAGFRVEELRGTSALDWCPLYHWRMNTTPFRQVYELATRLYPSLFAFHVTFVCRKTHEPVAERKD